jgi:hypothetical protein
MTGRLMLHNQGGPCCDLPCREFMADASGLAPMAPTSTPSSRTSEPSSTTTLMEKVQTPPKFVFGTGSSSSPFDFGSPLGGTSVYRHPKYYMDTDMVVFQVNDDIEGTSQWGSPLFRCLGQQLPVPRTQAFLLVRSWVFQGYV